MALMILGSVVFDLRNNITGWTISSKADFAKHDVVGSSPVYEAMGPGEKSVKLDCILHPYHFGGVGRLGALNLALDAQIPLSLMRGDGVPLGWHTIDEIDITHSELASSGVGQEIKFSLKLLRVDTPPLSLVPSIVSLLL